MRIQKTENTNFKGIANNKAVLSGLEKISEHGASFSVGAAFVGAALIRPFVISKTPSVEKENKQYAQANSLSSAIIKLAVALGVSLPVESAVKKIDKNPEKFLNSNTLKNLSKKEYGFLSQTIKLGTNFISAIPKSMLTFALIPLLMDKIFAPKKSAPPKKPEFDPVFEPLYSSINFQGKDGFAKKIARIMENEGVQKFAKKHSKNSQNIARNISNATDLLLTSTFILKTKKSDKIKEENKNPLIYNNIISTGASIIFGSALDKFVQKAGEKPLEKFIRANKNNPKLDKYLQGINILRPTIIFALVYYGLLPVASTFLAEKIDKSAKKNAET